MEYYYVNSNPQLTGEHEVHKSNCERLPNTRNCIQLGWFYRGSDALNEARRYYDNVDGCYYCSPEIHRK